MLAGSVSMPRRVFVAHESRAILAARL